MNPELLKRLDPIARRLGGYTAYTLDESEFVGEVPTIAEDRYGYLKYVFETEWGYEELPTFVGIQLQAAKIHPTWGEVHDYSYRKVDPENNRKQYHVHIWERGQWSEIFTHREYRPDITVLEGETVSEAIERLRTHYRPTYGETYEQGKACDDLRELVE